MMAYVVNGHSDYAVVGITGGKVFPLTTSAECGGISLVKMIIEGKDRPRYHGSTAVVFIHEAGYGWVRILPNPLRPSVVKQVELKPGMKIMLKPMEVYQLWSKPATELHVMAVFAPAWEHKDQHYLRPEDEEVMTTSPALAENTYA